jgi:hypothetical protein
MGFLEKLLLLVFCQSLAYAEELTEDSGDPSTNYVFDLPDLVANYPTHGEEVQLEAFGAREVNFLLYLSYLSYLFYLSLIYSTLLQTTQRMGKK